VNSGSGGLRIGANISDAIPCEKNSYNTYLSFGCFQTKFCDCVSAVFSLEEEFVRAT
jgi:hypothetical protein